MPSFFDRFRKKKDEPAPPPPSAPARPTTVPATPQLVATAAPSTPQPIRPSAAVAAPRPSPVVAGSTEWKRLALFLQQMYANPYTRRNQNELVMIHSRLYKSILDPPHEDALQQYHLTVIPADGDGVRMRNVMVLEHQVRDLLTELCSRSVAKLETMRHPAARVEALLKAFELYDKATFLARCFVMGAFDRVKRDHYVHTQEQTLCYCCEAKSIFTKDVFFNTIAMRVWREVALGGESSRSVLERFSAATFRSEWEGNIASDDHLMAVKVLEMCKKAGATAWFEELVSGEYEAFLQHTVSHFDGQTSSSEICTVLATRLRSDFIASVKWLPPSVLHRMQTSASRIIDGIHQRLGKDIEEWFVNGDTTNIQNLYYLYALQSSKMPNVSWLPSNLRTAAREHLERELTSATGCALDEIKGAPHLQQPQQLVDALQDWRGHYGGIVADCCAGNPLIGKALADAAAAALRPCGVILAYVVHHCMTHQAPVDQTIDVFNFVFPLVEEHDVCVANIAANLEVRLLGPNSNLEAEAQFVASIKQLFAGTTESRKMETMIRDIMASRDFQEHLDSVLEKQGKTQEVLPITVNVLQSNSWSIGSEINRNTELPRAFVQTMRVVEAAYERAHRRTRLQWFHNRSHVVLKSKCFKRGSYEFALPMIGCLILRAFDEHNQDTLTLAQILGNLNSASKPVQHFLDKFVSMKLIVKEETEKGVQFTLQRAFSSRTRKISLLPRTTINTAKTVNDAAVKADRDIVLQALLVRVMKTHRSMSHNELVAAVMQQLKNRFVPTIPAIKRNISTLMEKEYMERSEEDSSIYLYRA